MTQLSLLDRATTHATETKDQELVDRLLGRDIQWLSRLERTGEKPPPFGELEAICAVLELDPAETAKGNPP